MLRKAISVLLLAGIWVANPVMSDSLVVEGIQPDDAAGKPGRGLSQLTVERTWGPPSGKSTPVGEPPISAWDYGSFVVYFEYDKVIHSVAKR